MYKVVMMCYDSPDETGYADELAQRFKSEDEAWNAVEQAVNDELETLNNPPREDDMTFEADYDGDHACTIALWEPSDPDEFGSENDRAYWPVTIYDIVKTD